MTTTTVELKLPHHRYEVRIAPGSLRRLGDLVRDVAPHDRAALIVDAKLAASHGQTAGASLDAARYHVTEIAVSGAESDKNLDAVRGLYSDLVRAHLERKSPVIALGGGVIGDTVGFVAATYQRGLPFIQCPTSLLAMVDASVGGKVGVNLPEGKNLVGAFYHPRLVVIDTNTLATLPESEFAFGLAECVKHAVIRDPRKFHWLETNLDQVLSRDSDTLVELVRWNVQIKADVVMADEKEAGERAHLNFGHTFGHAIEATSGYGAYGHGAAVALGMVAAANLAVKNGMCERDLADRLVHLLDRIKLPTRADRLAPTPELLDAMQLDKKVADGKIRLVLPTAMGSVTIRDDVPETAIAAAWETLRRP